MVERHKPDRAMLETIAGLREILKVQVKQLHMHAFCMKHLRSVNGLPLHGDESVYTVVGPMVHMAAVSGLSLLKLTDELDLYVKDGFPVARAIVEGIVNVCYLMADGKDLAKKAIRHAEFMMIHDLKREWDVGSVKQTVAWQGKISPEVLKRYEELSSEFISMKGWVKSWSDKSLRQRLESALIRFDHGSLVTLNASAFAIYGTASEVVHGSYFSALYFYGLTNPQRQGNANSGGLLKALADHQFSVLFSAVFAYASFTECFSAFSEQPELMVEPQEALRRMRELPSLVSGSNDNSSNGQ